jgi:hypothetical protein
VVQTLDWPLESGCFLLLSLHPSAAFCFQRGGILVCASRFDLRQGQDRIAIGSQGRVVAFYSSDLSQGQTSKGNSLSPIFTYRQQLSNRVACIVYRVSFALPTPKPLFKPHLLQHSRYRSSVVRRYTPFVDPFSLLRACSF